MKKMALKVLSVIILTAFSVSQALPVLAYDRYSEKSSLISAGYSSGMPSGYYEMKKALDEEQSSWLGGLFLEIDKIREKKKLQPNMANLMAVKDESSRRGGTNSGKTSEAGQLEEAMNDQAAEAAAEKEPMVGARAGTADTSAPTLSKLAAANVTTGGATVNWTTNEFSTTQIQFGLTTQYGSQTTLDPSMVKSHSQTLSGLDDNTMYHYRVLSRDAAGNLAISKDMMFTTKLLDNTMPVLSSITSSNVTSTSSTINWTTNEATTTQIEFGSGVDSLGNPTYGSFTNLNASLTTSHTQTISNLQAGTIYHYRVRSQDAAGNLTVSSDLRFTTIGVTIQDTGISSLVQSGLADGVLDRAEMLSIYSQIAADGAMTTTEFGDLKTIQMNSGIYKQLDYVKTLADKVVLGNAANATIGNLTDTSSVSQLQALVGKWFLGTDHPVTSYGYTLAGGSLFSNGISYTDIDQGGLADCYFLASLAETALRQPDVIQSMFIDNLDGTYTIRMYKSGVADFLTVDRYLPTTSTGRLVYQGGGTYAATAELWAPLLEKAYATERYGSNTYASIEYGWMSTVLTEITNRVSVSLSTTASNFTSAVNYWTSGALMTFASITTPILSSVVGNHAYAVQSYDPTTQQFTLFNPWGTSYAMLKLAWDQITANFGSVQLVRAV